MISMLLPFSLSFSGPSFYIAILGLGSGARLDHSHGSPLLPRLVFLFLVGCGVSEVGVFVGVVLAPTTGVTIAVLGCNTHRRIEGRSLAGRTPLRAHWGREPSRAVPYGTLFWSRWKHSKGG